MFESTERNSSALEILGPKSYFVLGLVSLLVVPIALFVAFLDGSEGGGDGFIAKILFPFAFICQ